MFVHLFLPLEYLAIWSYLIDIIMLRRIFSENMQFMLLNVYVMIKQIYNSKDISLSREIYAKLETTIGIQIWKSTKYLYRNDSKTFGMGQMRKI